MSTDQELDTIEQFIVSTFGGGEVTVEDAKGETLTTTDLDALLDFIAEGDDPWIDLVTEDGVARGLTLSGDPDVVDPEPSFLTDDGMAYLFDLGVTLEEQELGVHMIPISEIVAVPNPIRYALDELDISTPGSEVEIVLSQGRHRQEKQGQWKPVKSVFGQFSDALRNHQAGKKDGPCFLQGEAIGGTRKAMAMAANYIIGVDLDSGKPLSDVMDAILDAGLEAVVYTTHSHLKDTSMIKRDHFLKWNDGEDPTVESIRDYLIVKKGLIPEILENVEIIEDGHHTEEGVVVLVKHDPIPKFRAVFPLSESFIFAKRGGTQKDAIAEWKERYAGFCTTLGFFFDETCADPARLFYLPRHPKNAVHGSWWVAGKPVNLDDYDRIKVKRDRRTRSQIAPDNVFSEMGQDEEERDHNRYIIDNFNLMSWAKEKARYFEIEDFLTEVCPDVLREPRGSKPGVHVECPFEAEHSTFGGGGTFVVNAGDNWQEGFESGFTFTCVHDACSHRDRLDFLKGCIEEGWFTVDDLKRSQHYMEVEEEEEDDDATTGPPPVKKNEPVYEESSDDEDDHLDDETKNIKYFNQRYAVVDTSSGTRILKEDLRRPDEDVVFLTKSDVALKEANRFIYVPGRDGKTERISAFTHWIQHPDRRSYDRIEFDPGDDLSGDTYNLFRGLKYEPVEGDWSLLRGHLFENMCDSDEELFDWVMTWMAHIVQCPGHKMPSLIAISGDKGVGKSSTFEYFGELFGRYYISVSDRKHITGNFNGHVATALLMICEEAFWAADPQSEGTLKHLISAKKVMVERKGIDAVMAKSYTRMVMISNNDWIVPASLKDERRFCVLHCKDTHRGDLDFFTAVEVQMRQQGGMEAMLYELMHYVPKTGNWNCLYTPPQTEHLTKQQVQSLDGMDQFMLNLIRNGIYEPSDDNIDPIELDEKKETTVYAKELRQCIIDYVKFMFSSDKAKTTYEEIERAVLDWFGAKSFRLKSEADVNRRLAFRFPPLDEVREGLMDRKGLTVEATEVD